MQIQTRRMHACNPHVPDPSKINCAQHKAKYKILNAKYKMQTQTSCMHAYNPHVTNLYVSQMKCAAQSTVMHSKMQCAVMN